MAIQKRKIVYSLPTATNVKLPLTKQEHLYETNVATNDSSSLLLNDNPSPGTSLYGYFPWYTLANSDRHEVAVVIPKHWNAVVKKIRIFTVRPDAVDFGGVPSTLYITKRGSAKQVVATFMNESNQTWMEFNVTSPAITDSFSIEGGGPANGNGAYYGARFELVGDFNDVPWPVIPRQNIPTWRDMYGVNCFAWDWMQNESADPDESRFIYAPKANRWSVDLNLGSVRLYHETGDIFHWAKGVWAFNPTFGGHFLDPLFTGIKARGVEALFCLQTTPASMWPGYGGQFGFPGYDSMFLERDKVDANLDEDAMAYDTFAQILFIAAGRYGANTNIDPALMGTPMAGNVDPTKNYPPFSDNFNEMKIGLNLIKYFEVGNELDKHWKGHYAYMHGRRYAALMSACYDGHKGALGPGHGAKNADPTCKVVMSGLALARMDAVKGMTDWCREHRGYLPDGSVDFPCDVINYHQYPTNSPGGEIQSGMTTAMAPEISNAPEIAERFIDGTNQLVNGRDVWISELGIDDHPESVMGAPPINKSGGGTYNREEVAGIWTIRLMLLYLSKGINKLQYFKSFGVSDNDDAQYFNSMRLLNYDVGTVNDIPGGTPRTWRGLPQYSYPRVIVSDFMAQLKIYHPYRFDGWVISSGPYVIRLKHPTTQAVAYIVWSLENYVPTTEPKFSNTTGPIPAAAVYTWTEVAGTYALALPANPLIKIKTLVNEADTMAETTHQVVGGSYNVAYGSKPVVIEIQP